MNWLIDDGSTRDGVIATPSGPFTVSYRPATGREVHNWLGGRAKTGMGDADVAFIAAHLTAWPCSEPISEATVGRLLPSLIGPLADMIAGYRDSDVVADAELGN